jgi:cold shock CspA family protein/ribosome-associated translation inhibitor RaiA
LQLALRRLVERPFMKIPLQISFENAEPSEAVREAIKHEVERLEKYRHDVTGCRVAVVAPSSKHRHGGVYRVNIWVTIPPRENIVVSHQPCDDQSHVHVEVAIKDAFATARRQIDALAQRASGQVKLHEIEAHGQVSKISGDYGFIATPDEREVYFHRNSVIEDAFARLSVGSEVRFAEELGEKGAQASTVHLIGKHHLSEQNHKQ